MLPISILGSGKYLPKKKRLSAELDDFLGLAPGTIEARTGVQVRHHVLDEVLPDMAAAAARDAVADAGLKLEDIDLIISAGASPYQIIPCNAVHYQKALGLGHTHIPCFDIDSTCLSFMVALDTAACLIAIGRYRHILIISSEIASHGLNRDDIETYGLFGDGAAAFVVGPSESSSASAYLGHRLETYSEGVELCELVGGGSRLPAYVYASTDPNRYLFHMDGPQLFKHAIRQLPRMLDDFMKSMPKVSMEAVKMVIPHQASLSAMTLVRRRLGIDPERFMHIIQNHGNCIAASIPMALHEAIKQGLIKRGDNFLLLGTGAGLSTGTSLLRY